MEADGQSGSPSGSVPGDSGYGTMAATEEDKTHQQYQRTHWGSGGVDESIAAEHLLDVEWRDDNPLFVFNNNNSMKPQTPAATLTPV